MPSGSTAQRPTGTTRVLRHSTAFDGLEMRNQNGIWHRLTNANTIPALTAGTALGTSPTVSNSGTDMAGVLTLVCGTSPGAAATNVVTVAYAVAYSAQPFVALTAYSGNFYDAGFYVESSGSGNFVIRARNVLVAGATYRIGYQIQN